MTEGHLEDPKGNKKQALGIRLACVMQAGK